MRFDDSLDTVLSAETSSTFGAQSAWRQLVDLIGRGRVAGDVLPALDRLKAIRGDVPSPVRAASARALADADPPFALVGLFADDDPAIAAPVLRVAKLRDAEWITLLPMMAPAARSILRHRRDLSADVGRALESFGGTDFVLSTDHLPTIESPAAPEAPPAPMANGVEPAIPFPAESPFVSFASIAKNLPVVAEALRRSGGDTDSADVEGEPAPPKHMPDPVEVGDGTFQIADLVARIEAYQRRRDGTPLGGSAHVQAELFPIEQAQAAAFRFETDAGGIVRWVHGASRSALIGLSLDFATGSAGPQVDGVATGAFRRRAGFTNARLTVGGMSDAGGAWRITGTPAFDRETGRFTGYRGTARRPRVEESAAPLKADGGADILRQLVHELRTPTNAIAGFAEMIEGEMLGPVPDVYRGQARVIRTQVADLIAAIEDIDTAARIESHALDLRPGRVPLAPLLVRIAGDLQPLATLRGATVAVGEMPDDLAVLGDDLAVERLISRLMATLVASGGRGEAIAIAAMPIDQDTLSIVFDRPAALASYGEDALLTIDAETEAEAEGAPLLGTGFALRLARNLASELGGGLTIGSARLTLRLPADVTRSVEQVSSH